jgi:hypothetical protein
MKKGGPKAALHDKTSCALSDQNIHRGHARLRNRGGRLGVQGLLFGGLALSLILGHDGP